MLDIAANREKNKSIFIINLSGRIDAGTARDFESFFSDIMRKGNRFFILEAENLDYISSAGIGALVRLIQRLKAQDGAGGFINLNNEIAMLMDFFGLNEELPIFSGIDEARASLSSILREKNCSLEFKKEEIIAISKTDVDSSSVPQKNLAENGNVVDEGATPIIKGADVSQNESRFIEAMATPISAMEDDDIRIEIRKNIREILKEEQADLNRDTQKTGNHLHSSDVNSTEESEDKVRSESVDKTETSTTSDKATGDGANGKNGTKSDIKKEIQWPSIVACEQCGENIRIYRAGLFMCPSCKIKIRVNDDGTPAFMEKLELPVTNR